MESFILNKEKLRFNINLTSVCYFDKTMKRFMNLACNIVTTVTLSTFTNNKLCYRQKQTSDESSKREIIRSLSIFSSSLLKQLRVCVVVNFEKHSQARFAANSYDLMTNESNCKSTESSVSRLLMNKCNFH